MNLSEYWSRIGYLAIWLNDRKKLCVLVNKILELLLYNELVEHQIFRKSHLKLMPTKETNFLWLVNYNDLKILLIFRIAPVLFFDSDFIAEEQRAEWIRRVEFGSRTSAVPAAVLLTLIFITAVFLVCLSFYVIEKVHSDSLQDHILAEKLSLQYVDILHQEYQQDCKVHVLLCHLIG